MGKKLNKKEAIKKMESYRFGCSVRVPGLKCAYRAIYYSEILKHIQNHRKSIKSNIRTNARQYEVEEIASQKEEKSIQKSTQSQYVAIFGSDGQCVHFEQEIFFSEIEKKYQQKLITFDETNDLASTKFNGSNADKTPQKNRAEVEFKIGTDGLNQQEATAKETKLNQRQSVQESNSDMLHSDNINEDLMTGILEQEATAGNFIHNVSQGKNELAVVY